MTVTCRVLKLSRQPYYRWLADPVTPSETVEAYRANALFDAHKDDPEFGHRLLADEARDVGEVMSDRTSKAGQAPVGGQLLRLPPQSATLALTRPSEPDSSVVGQTRGPPRVP